MKYVQYVAGLDKDCYQLMHNKGLRYIQILSGEIARLALVLRGRVVIAEQHHRGNTEYNWQNLLDDRK